MSNVAAVGNAFLSSHPEWLCGPLAYMGMGPATTLGFYHLDPGSPEVQEYLISIVRELVVNYEIDGIHWDFIRHLSRDAGYPGRQRVLRFRPGPFFARSQVNPARPKRTAMTHGTTSAGAQSVNS